MTQVGVEHLKHLVHFGYGSQLVQASWMRSNLSNVMSQLYSDLSAFDGRAITILGEIRKKHEGSPSFIADLVVLAASDEPNISEGATWLLKAMLEDGHSLKPAQTRKLIDNFQHISRWQAQLHVCQLLERVDVPSESASAVADWLSPLLRHDRPFLRAWSMNALQHLAAQHYNYSARAKAALIEAETDKSASVRARVRKIQT